MAETNWPVQISSTGVQPVIAIGQLQANYNKDGNRANLMMNMVRSVATNPGSGMYIFSMPPGLLIDSNNVIFDDGASFNGSFIGDGRFHSSSGFHGILGFRAYSPTQLIVVAWQSSTNYGYWTATYPLWNVVANISISITLPIQGWV